MKKKYKIALGVLLVLVVVVVVIPEKHYKNSRNEAIEYVSNEYDIPPFLSKFVVNTKLGRKIAFIFTKKTINNSLKKDKEPK